MLRTALWTLRQPRYAAMAALMGVVAVGCVIAGTWQIERYERTARINKALSGNAHAAGVPLEDMRLPAAGGAGPTREAIRYRTVTVTGTYLQRDQQLIDSQADDGSDGFDVLDPLQTAGGVLLVVRGFIAANGQDALPKTVPPPPAGIVRLTGRLETGSTSADGFGSLGPNEITKVNPSLQAARMQTTVYNAYLNLNANQPGSADLTALDAPDLSNPAGGAVEPQHLAYIVQWYLFALLALAAPFAMARYEVRESRRRLLGIDPSAEEFDLKWEREHANPAALEASAAPGTALATREDGSLVQWREPTAREWQRAATLADRYGRSLGLDQPGSAKPGRRRRRYFVIPGAAPQARDAYRDSYNDYLWELALADGATPDIPGADPKQVESPPNGPRPAELE